MHHHKFEEVVELVKNNMPVLLIGEKGSGKTTLAMQVAESMGLKYYTLAMTRQTTLSYLLGYMNVNGEYIPSQLRHAFTEGGLFLLDEMDGGDANVLLSLNNIENGYIGFPDGVQKAHPDFRLMATANPQNEHHNYTGRSKLDAATLDRFDQVPCPRDDTLEASLVSQDVFEDISLVREVLAEHNSSIEVTMRDSIRLNQRRKISMEKDFIRNLFKDNEIAWKQFQDKQKERPTSQKQVDCENANELLTLLKYQYNHRGN